MKLLLDQGLPRSSALMLRASGFDAVHTGECGLSIAIDRDILSVARNQQRHILTLDSDFHTIVALENWTRPSVIRIRIEGLKGKKMARLICQVIESCEQDLKEGALVSVEEGRIRVRRLPITKEQ